MKRSLRGSILLALLAAILAGTVTPVASQNRQVALAYVLNDSVWLADADGNPVMETGPTFGYGEGARLFWTPDGDTLYIATSNGLYATGADGGAAVRVPGSYGRTLTISQDGITLYYLDTISPQTVEDQDDNPDNDRVSFPLREMEISLIDGSPGRNAGYFGRFDAGAAVASVAFAGALYVRDGGLLGAGRPNLWPSYGANVFGTCCFPRPGLGRFDVHTGDFQTYDPDFIPGPAAVNLTRTHLAGPTTSGAIRIIDLITGGVRDYVIQYAGGLGTVERIAWSPDDTYLYLLTQREASNPMYLNSQPPFEIDARSANVHLYRLNLVSSVIRELAWRPDVYGVSALAATDRYVFAVVIDPNTDLVAAWNARQIRGDATPNDASLQMYMPGSRLWRVSVDGGDVRDAGVTVWGVAARPIR